MPRGTIKFFNPAKGFGFIEQEEGKDLFVHISETSDNLNEGDEVEYDIGESRKGPCAVNVKKI
jgi:CspA family cold shock protein